MIGRQPLLHFPKSTAIIKLMTEDNPSSSTPNYPGPEAEQNQFSPPQPPDYPPNQIPDPMN